MKLRTTAVFALVSVLQAWPALSQTVPQMPEDQRQFIAAIEKGRTVYANAGNEMAKGAARPLRAKDICSALPRMTVKDWVGQISSLSSNSEGKGVLSIQIAKGVEVKTWNNALSDIGDKTLIDARSPVFDKVLTLKENQRVIFSGSFIKNPTDCVRESSMTLSGSIEEPEFIFKFSDLKPVQ